MSVHGAEVFTVLVVRSAVMSPLLNPTTTPQLDLDTQQLLHISPTHLGGHPVKVLIVFHPQVHVQVPGVVDSV